MISTRLKEIIRDVPDFPKPGIIFKDITPILLDPQLTRDIIDEMVNHVKSLNLDAIVGIESRGFLFGFPLAQKLGVPFVLIRKKGKLPAETHQVTYDLEYGSATLEIHKDALCMNDKILIHDDLLATGGTACATAKLVELCGASVAGFSSLIELSFLNGNEEIAKFTKNIINLARY